jgi:hypothetical protein
VIAIVGLVLALAAGAAAEERYASVKFVVVKDRNGKPIRNASVVLHEVNKHGRQEKGGMQLKTDNDGKTGFDGVPYGKLRVQVIARGFQTFGQDYDVNQAEMQFNIRMKPPQDQVTIYGKKDEAEKPAETPTEEKKPETPKEESKEVPK